MRSSFRIPTLFIMVCFALPAAAETIRVPADQPTIQAGIDAAVDGDTVLVADGTYTGEGNRDIDFKAKEVLVASENGPENCIIDCQSTPGDPHRGFHFHSGEGWWSYAVSGFTITGGGVWGTGSDGFGGAILCEGASPSIENNIIIENSAGNAGPAGGGGGIACIDASPMITGNTISLNVSYADGGGIHLSGDSEPSIWDNSITGNIADDWQQGAGGGIYVSSIGTAAWSTSIRGNLIEGNNADVYGGGIAVIDSKVSILDNRFVDNQSGTGGGLYFALGDGEVWSNEFTGNSGWGGGIFHTGSAVPLEGNLVIDNDGEGILCFSASPSIAVNAISGNSGRGILCRDGSSPLITANTITDNLGGGLSASGAGSAPVVQSNFIVGNITSSSGGGVYCTSQVSMTLRDNTIRENSAQENGGGICCQDQSTVVISGRNLVSLNSSDGEGGGIYIRDCPEVDIDTCRIVDNEASSGGGGMLLSGSTDLDMTNVLLTGNLSGEFGGGMKIESGSTVQVGTSTISANTANMGAGIFSWGTVGISDSIIHGNLSEELTGEFTVSYSDIGGGWAGEGNIDADPLFVSGPFGDFFLSQIAAGQAVDSPCVDAGDPAGGIPEGTTRTDLVQDEVIPDMGYHHALVPGSTRLVTGPGPGEDNPPLVRTFPPIQDAVFEHAFAAYGVPKYGVNVSVGDFTGAGLDTILTGAGPGAVFGPHVRGFAGDGTPLPGLSFLAYGTIKWGVNVAAGDLDGDGFDEIVTGAGPGDVYGPHVRGWNFDGGSMVTDMAGVNFFAYGTPRWGVNVSAGDIDGDGFDEIVTGAGPGSVYGAHVRGWDYDGSSLETIPEVSFLAYGTHQFGVEVSCGDVDSDGIDEIVTAPGPGSIFGAHVRGWNYDGAAITPLTGLNFFAWEYPAVRYGAKVYAGTDIDKDGRDDLVVGGGPDPAIGTSVNIYRFDGAETTFWFSLEGYEGLTHGTNVAAGHF